MAENAFHFIGFSTVGRVKPPFTLQDIDLVKQDLLNHFSTRRGERVMMPTFGTRIYELLMDPMDDTTREAMLEDIDQVVGLDKRVVLRDRQIFETDNAIQIELELLYLPTGITETIALQFNRDTQE